MISISESNNIVTYIEKTLDFILCTVIIILTRRSELRDTSVKPWSLSILI